MPLCMLDSNKSTEIKLIQLWYLKLISCKSAGISTQHKVIPKSKTARKLSQLVVVKELTVYRIR
jgi:hypothetical protein